MTVTLKQYGSCKNGYDEKWTEEVILDPAHKTEPPTRENKDGFEMLVTSTSVTVFFWFISPMSIKVMSDSLACL